MRRIDVIAIGIGIFLAGGGLFLGFRLFGLDGISAGIWSQAVMVGGVVAWLASYLLRVVTRNMTLNQQMDDYESRFYSATRRAEPRTAAYGWGLPAVRGSARRVAAVKPRFVVIHLLVEGHVAGDHSQQ
jgi:hypothetical protein